MLWRVSGLFAVFMAFFSACLGYYVIQACNTHDLSFNLLWVGAEFGLGDGSDVLDRDLGPFAGLIGYDFCVRFFDFPELFAEGFQELDLPGCEWLGYFESPPYINEASALVYSSRSRVGY